MKAFEIKVIFVNVIRALKNNRVHLIGTKKFPTYLTARDIHQRADEVCLLYSAIMEISFNDAKEFLNAEVLFTNLEEEQKK